MPRAVQFASDFAIRSRLWLKGRDDPRRRCNRRSRRTRWRGLYRRSIVESVTHAANLPAATEGTVGLDQALSDFASGLRQRVLLQDETLLELRDSGEVDGARFILHEPQ